jgi:hypothetical protein
MVARNEVLVEDWEATSGRRTKGTRTESLMTGGQRKSGSRERRPTLLYMSRRDQHIPGALTEDGAISHKTAAANATRNHEKKIKLPQLPRQLLASPRVTLSAPRLFIRLTLTTSNY